MSRDARTGEPRTVMVSALASQGRRQSQPPALSQELRHPAIMDGETPDGEITHGITLTPPRPIPTSASRITQSGPTPESLPYYGYSGWEDYSGRNFLKCVPGTMTKLDDGQMYRCQ